MRPLYKHVLVLSFFLICNNSIANSPIVEDCSGDPIYIESTEHRELLSLSGAENIISYCNLEIGETYEIYGHSISNTTCQFSISNIDGANTTSLNPSELASLRFTAEANCMDFEVETSSCVNLEKYQAWLSMICISCETDIEEPESDSRVAPIDVDLSLTTEELIQDIFIGGDCFDVSNVGVIGNSSSRGFFVNGDASIGLGKGVILSTGQATAATGPCGPNASGFGGGASDPDLVQLAGTNIGDAVGIEFDFVPTLDQLSFNYVFASEEYCEFVGQFNDVFGFFISGPGITGPFTNGAENVALIPGTTTQVAINNVNQNTNTQYFNPNAQGSCGAETNCADIKYDGYTSIFVAEIDGLTACETYHIKLVIGDAGDSAFDSAVFLERGSFDAGGEFDVQVTVPGAGGDTAFEACQDGQIIFTRNSLDLDMPLDFSFELGGSATPGVDFVDFPTTFTFPAGVSTYIIDVDILPDGLVEGLENLTILIDDSACSCTGQAGELFIEDYVDMAIVLDDITVCGQENSTLAPAVNGGAPLFTYVWSTGATSSTIDVSPASTTTYTVTVTDACSNEVIEDVTIEVQSQPTATLSGTAAICAGDPNPSATLTVTFSGQGPWDLTYLFNGSPQPVISGITENPFSLVVNSSGTYTLSNVENQFCAGSASGSVVVSEVDVILNSIPTDAGCNGASTGSIDLTVTGGDAPFTYSWDNGAMTEDIGNLPMGDYSVLVTDANGCTETTSVTVSEAEALSTSIIEIAPVSCFGDFNGAIDLTVLGGTPGYTYQWSNGSFSEDLSQLVAGVYTVTVTDMNNCMAINSITLEQPDQLLASANVLQNVSCFGGDDGSVDLTTVGGTAPYFYVWSNGSDLEDPNDLTGGLQTVLITDVSGCTFSLPVSITEPLPLLLNAIETQGVDCNNPTGGAADLTVAGGIPGYTYMWDDGTMGEDPGSLSVGSHIVTVTDANGCSETTSVEITSNTEEPTVDISASGEISCTSSNVTLDGSGSAGTGTVSYEWQDENGNIIDVTESIDVAAAGNYTLIITDDSNGCTASLSESVEENAEVPTADAQVSGDLDCINTSASLDGSASTGTGTLSYEWQDENGVVIAQTAETDVLDSGQYTLVITDAANGCTSSAMVTVDQNVEAPTIDAQASGLIDCIGDPVSLDGSASTGNGTLQYEWLDANDVSVGTTASVEVNTSGTYTLIITDAANGCTAETTVDVDEDTVMPTIDAQVMGTITCIDLSATLDGSSSSGTGTLEYEWFDANGVSVGQTAEVDASNPGEYTLIITDSGNGCTAETSVEVMENVEEPISQVTIDGELTCDVISVTVDGSGSSGSGTLEYEWQDENGNIIDVTESIDVAAAGSYTLIVTDISNGCTASATETLAENSEVPTADVQVSGDLDCINTMATLDGSGSTGNGTLSYEWQDENGTIIAQTEQTDIVNPGQYDLVVTNTESGCTSTASITVEQNIESPTIDAQALGLIDCIGDPVSLDGSGSTGNGTLQYEWLDANDVSVGTTASVEVNTSGTYTLIITDDGNGCTAETTIDVDENIEAPTIDAQVMGTLTCVDLNATLDGSSSSGTGTLEYEWFDANGVSVGQTAEVDASNPGEYTLIITDGENGCTAETIVEVLENVQDPTPEATVNEDLSCDVTEVTLDGSGSTANGTLNYEWQDENGTVVGNTVDLSVNTGGEYTLIITDAENGCTANTTVEVMENGDLPTPVATADGILTCIDEEVNIDASASTSTGTLSYEWFDSDGNSIGVGDNLDVILPDNYSVVVTDTESGCTASLDVDVDQNINTPESNAGQGASLTCSDSEVTLNGGGSTAGNNISYEWLNSGNVTVGEDVMVDVTETGIYTLIVTNTDNGCTATSTVEVTPDADLPTADAGSGADLTCLIDQVTLNGSGSTSGNDISYEWFDPNGTSISADLMIDVSMLGTYTLVVTNDDNGCSASSSVEVGENIIEPSADAGAIQFITCLQSDVTLDGSDSEGNSLSYEWFDANGVSISNDITVVVNGAEEYTLVVTDMDNGCTASSTVEVQTDAAVPVAVAGDNGLLNCLIDEYTLDGSASTGGNLSYEWQDVNGVTIGMEATTVVSQSGMYTLIITDGDNGCTATSSALVDEDFEAPVADAGADPTISCLETNALLDGLASTGMDLSFEWQNVGGDVLGSEMTYSTEEEGVYILIVTNNENGCTATDEIEVFGNFDTPIVNPGLDALLTCDISVTTLDGSASTANGTLSFEWFDENNVSVSNIATYDASTPGTYSLVVTDMDNGCSQTSTVDVDQNIATPTANSGNGATLTCTDTEVTLSGSGTSQSGNVSFEWFNEGGVSVGDQASVNVDQTGMYTLVVTDTDNGCTAMSSVGVVPDANLPTANAGLSSTINCSISTAMLNAENSSTGMNISYEWLDENGVSIGAAITQEVNSSGVYTLVVTDGTNGCSATSSVEIFEDIEEPNAFAGTDPTLTCDETETTLDGSGSTSNTGNLTYEWQDEQGMIISAVETVVIESPGIYSLVVTGENGCTATDMVEVFVDADVPVADVGLGGLLDCNVSVLTLGGANTSSGNGISYVWQDENGVEVATTSTTDVSLPGTYTLIVSNANNNCETTASLTIEQNIETPSVDAGINTTLNCEITTYEIGGQGTSTGGMFSYEWTNANGDLISGDLTTTISDPDTYTLLVTNTMNGCTATADVVVGQDITTPVSDAGQGGVLSCDDIIVTLDGSNSSGQNLSYEWLNEAGVVISTSTVFDASEIGTYTLVVTNTMNGCSSESTAIITPDANLPTALASTNGTLTCINDDVMLDGGNSSSVSGNISFEWLNENQITVANTSDFNTSISGQYTLIVTDTNNGCTSSTTVEVFQDIQSPSADAGLNQTLVCGQTDVALSGAGGNGQNLSYEWLDPLGMSVANTQDVNVSIAGVYTLIVTNTDNGCTASSTTEIVPDTNLPTAEAGAAATITCTDSEVVLDGSGSSMGTDFSYEWQDGNGVVVGTNVTLQVSDAGTYTLFVTDNSNNCQSQDQVLITEDTDDPTAFADFGSAQSLDCSNTSLTLDGSGSQPFGDLTFLWTTTDGNIDSGDDTFNPEINQPGTYTLLVTNTQNGCTDVQEITVAQDVSLPEVSIQNPDIITCINDEVILDATASSNTGNLSYDWTGPGISTGQNTLELTVNQSGTFTLTITNDDNGCVNDASVTVDENTTPPTVVASTNEEFDCLTESVSISGTGSSAGTNYTYQWSGNGTIENDAALNTTVFEPGVYTLLVTDTENGCTQSNTVTVNESDNVPSGIDALVDHPLCFGDQGSISIAEIIGGTGPFLVSLDGGENFTSQTAFANLDPGNYNVVIQDSEGCEYSEQLTIDGQAELEVLVEPSVLLQFGDNYQIDALTNFDLQDIDTIIWSPTEGLSCTDCLNPSVDTILESITYNVTIVNLNGCSDTDEIILRVAKDKDVYVPNAFSPGNLDGINDFVTVYGNAQRINQINSFQVFNRWGELVFENFNFLPNNPTEGWDGKFRGEQLNPAVYVYWTEVEFIDGSKEIFKGDITITD